MTPDRRYQLIGLACAVGGTVLFGAKAIVFKLASEAGGSVEQMMALRMGFSLPIFLAVGFWSLRGRVLRPDTKNLLIAAGLGIMTYHAGTWLDFQGLLFISAQLERLILFTYPAIVAVFAWVFLGDRLTWRHGLALTLSYVGVFLLFGREAMHEGGNVLIGGALVMGAALFMAINVTISKSVIAALGAALFTSVAMGSAAGTILLHSVITAGMGEFPPFTPEIITYGIILAVFCTAMPSFLLSEGIARLGPGPASAVGNAGPVATALLAVVVLNEAFGWPHAIALVLTSVGVSLLGSDKRSTPKSGQLIKNTG